MLNWAKEYGSHEIIRELVNTDEKWEIIMAYQTMNIMEKLSEIENYGSIQDCKSLHICYSK